MSNRPPKPGSGASTSARCIALADTSVPYTLVRSRRKTIGLSIDHRGLRVGAPPTARLGDIEGLIRQHAGWILDKLRHWQDKASPGPSTITDGLVLPYLGGQLTVRLAAGSNRAQWHADASQLTLGLRQPTPELARRVLENALRQRVRALFASRLAFFCARLGVAPPPLALTSARTRWGSCSQRSGIRLNWRLVHFPVSLIDYVVAHEVAHLKEMNHSPRFWSVVETLYPTWREARAELKHRGAACPLF